MTARIQNRAAFRPLGGDRYPRVAFVPRVAHTPHFDGVKKRDKEPAVSGSTLGGTWGRQREPQNFGSTLRGTWAGSASRRSSILLESGLGGKFQAKSSGWDENRTSLEGDVLEVAVRNRRRVLTHVPAGSRPAPSPAQHYFPTEE
jgi:hypothetical protein